jgi:hypothetical protein
MATIRDKVGHLETLPIDLLLRASRCVLHFQSLGCYERWSKLLLCNPVAQKKAVYNSFGLNNLRRYFVANRCHTP